MKLYQECLDKEFAQSLVDQIREMIKIAVQKAEGDQSATCTV